MKVTFPFLLVPLLLLTIPYSHSVSTFTTKSGQTATIQKISHTEQLNKCRVKVSNDALYICEDSAYIFLRSSGSDKFSSSFTKVDSVFQGDIDSKNVTLVSPNRLNYIRDMKTSKEEIFDDEIPMLASVITRPFYTSIITLFQPKEPGVEHTGHNETARNYTGTFVIRNNMISNGNISHRHNIKFPMEGHEFVLTNASFKQMETYTDMYFGHDYLFVVMEKGWLYVFKNMFEDPQMDFIHSELLKEGYEIHEIAISGNLLFSLFKTNSTHHLMLQIYTITLLPQFRLAQECSLNITTVTDHPFNSQLRAKSIKNTFLIAVNFPGSHILVYTLQKPINAIFPITCPTSAYELNYTDSSIGFSFDYTTTYPEQGFLLSPSTANSHSSYFIPYCMPNHRLVDNGACVVCDSGYSDGGLVTACNSCNNVVGSTHTLVSGHDPMEETCRMTCNDPHRFGRDCQVCKEYLISSRAVLPPESSWDLSPVGECGFMCNKTGMTDNIKLGVCLTEDQDRILNNNCAEIKDCQNCSMTQSCGWCGNTCKKFHFCHPDDKDGKTSVIEDFFVPSVSCDQTQARSPLSRGLKGTFSFKKDTVHKNDLFLWPFDAKNRQNNMMNLTLHANGIAKEPWDNLPNIYVSYCKHGCYTVPVVLKDGETFTISGTEIWTFGWIEELISENAMNYRLEYSLYPIYNFMDEVFGMLRLFSHFIFICIVLNCLIATRQQFRGMHRRRRLVRQLQELDLLRLIDHLEQQGVPNMGQEDHEHPRIDPEEVIENSRIVNRVVFSVEDNEFAQTECPICLEAFRNEEGIAKLVCKHLFHVRCFSDWVKNVHQLKCPVCNRVLDG